MKKEKGCMFKLSVLFLLIACRLSLTTGANAATTVCKWKDNKQAAFSMMFDDSLFSHATFIIPNFISRGLVGTFFVIPGSLSSAYGFGIMTWESLCSRTGMDIENHTLTHNVDMTDSVADFQIGECANLMWNLWTPGESRLGFVSAPGSNLWTLTAPKKDEIANKYFIYRPTLEQDQLYLYYSRMNSTPGSSLVTYAQNALNAGTWKIIYGHGVGPQPEFLSESDTDFLQLLNYLVTVKDNMWIATAKDACKYDNERQTANVSVLEETSSIVRLNLASTFSVLPADPALYDYPLTLITDVPGAWPYCKITQGSRISIKQVNSGKVMYEAIPGRGEIKLESSSSMDITPPGTPVVRDGTGTDTGIITNLNQISANWDNCTDAETGIAKYWYRVGTTSGGSEILDWIDNGTFTYVTTSRTNLTLSKGVTYYMTVKAVNGVGLESTPGTSDGQYVPITQGYVKFYENFESGTLNRWSVAQTAGNNTIQVSQDSAYQSNYGLKCHVEDINDAVVIKTGISNLSSNFVHLNFKLLNLNLPQLLTTESGDPSPDGKLLTLMTITDANTNLVGQMIIGNDNVTGINLYFQFRNTTDWHCLPMWPGKYGGYLPISTGTWHSLDLHVKACDNTVLLNGGLEIWIDGAKAMSVLRMDTTGMEARNIELGVKVNSQSSGITGDVYFDNIIWSDSLYTPFATAPQSIEDTTPPANILQVRDGTGADVNSINSINPADPITQLSANWDVSSDIESGIAKYWYAIGTSQGGTDTLGWTDNGTATAVTKTGLSLTANTKYYFSVKAENGGGVLGSPANSDGQTVIWSGGGDGNGGSLSNPVYPSLYSISGNSQMKFLVSGASGGEVKIYTTNGKLVSSLRVDSGANINWDGTNDDGQKVARGIYIYSITDGNGNKKGKFAVTR